MPLTAGRGDDFALARVRFDSVFYFLVYFYGFIYAYAAFIASIVDFGQPPATHIRVLFSGI